MALARARRAAFVNRRYRRIFYQPPGFRHWNNTELHSGAGLNWIYNSDESLTHVSGTTQTHYYWAGLHTTPENWEGVVRRPLDPLPGEKGLNAIITASFIITGRTVGSCAMMIQENLGSYYSVNGVNNVRVVNISSTSATQFYGFSMVPSTDFDGTVSLPIVHNVERLG